MRPHTDARDPKPREDGAKSVWHADTVPSSSARPTSGPRSLRRIALAVLALVTTACATIDGASSVGTIAGSRSRPTEARETTLTNLDDNVRHATRTWPTEWTKSEIELNELVLGVGSTEPRDAIPPIDDPTYETPSEAASWLEDREPGALVEVDGDVRFLPLSIMTRHEIVNDEVGGVPVAITYCPLCNSALTFDRRVDGDVLRFGVSGLLRNSDLVMWDDRTVSLWQQFTGEALVGDYAGSKLAIVSTAIVSFGDFRASFPHGRSLSRDTGFDLTYGTNPYENYSGRFAPMMPVEAERDDRFLPMERVVGVSLGDGHKAFPFGVLAERRAINDSVADVPVVVFWGSPDTADALNRAVIADSKAIGTAIAFSPVVDGRVLTFESDGDGFVDTATDSTWSILGVAVDGPLTGRRLATVPHRNDFWFAWSAFFPAAEVYDAAS